MENPTQKPIYALVVGIDKYNPPVPALGGAVADAIKIKGFLEKNYGNSPLYLKVLLNEEATYDSLISAFRGHLGQAGKDDVIWFHYSGHGSRQASAPELEALNSGSKDETLVLYDSRPSGKDLADKELGLLIYELSKNGAHIIVSLDCCHSGSGTRNADITGVNLYRARLTDDRGDRRALSSYLDGYFEKNDLVIPEAKHVLFAACNRFQTAKESWSGSGLFTENLLKTLESIDRDISYADLFVKLRYGVVGMKWDQDPQIEPMGGFNGFGRFLDGSSMPDTKKYAVYYNDDAWQMEAGEILGFYRGDEMSILILSEETGDSVCKASIKESSAQFSLLKPELELDKNLRYWAVPSRLESMAEPVVFFGDEDARMAFEIASDGYTDFKVVDSEQKETGRFYIKQDNSLYELIDSESSITIAKTDTEKNTSKALILRTLQQVIRWNKLLGLQNKKATIAETAADIILEVKFPNGESRFFGQGDILLPGTGEQYHYRLMIQNHFTQSLHFSLLYLSGLCYDYCIFCH
jgi:hypothetical protein